MDTIQSLEAQLEYLALENARIDSLLLQEKQGQLSARSYPAQDQKVADSVQNALRVTQLKSLQLENDRMDTLLSRQARTQTKPGTFADSGTTVLTTPGSGQMATDSLATMLTPVRSDDTIVMPSQNYVRPDTIIREVPVAMNNSMRDTTLQNLDMEIAALQAKIKWLEDSAMQRPNPQTSYAKPAIQEDNTESQELRNRISALEEENNRLKQQATSQTTSGSSDQSEELNALRAEIISLRNRIDNTPKRGSALTTPVIVPSVGLNLGKTKEKEIITKTDTVIVQATPDTIRQRDTVLVTDTVTRTVTDTMRIKELQPVANGLDTQRILAMPPLVILFDVGSSKIKQVYLKSIDYYAAQALKSDYFSLQVSGHADKTGNVQNNQALSQKRADAVADYLMNKGVKPGNIHTNANGDADPIANNNTKEGKSQNRRVEVTIRKK